MNRWAEIRVWVLAAAAASACSTEKRDYATTKGPSEAGASDAQPALSVADSGILAPGASASTVLPATASAAAPDAGSDAAADADSGVAVNGDASVQPTVSASSAIPSASATPDAAMDGCTGDTCGVNIDACPDGFSGTDCQTNDNIDECATNNGGCGSATYWACTDEPGAAPLCEDIDQCATNNGDCGLAPDFTCTDNPNAPPTCSCTPMLQFRSVFQVTMSTSGCSTSAAIGIVGNTNTMVVDFNTWDVRKSVDSSSLVTSVVSDDWTVSFTGPDADFLNTELAPYYTQGGRTNNGVFDITDGGEYYLYILPDDTEQHLYTHVRTYSGPLPAQDVGGFPVLETRVIPGAEITFFDFVGSTECNLYGPTTASFEVVYRSCE